MTALLSSSVNCRDEYTEEKWFYRTFLELTEVPDDIPDEAIGVYINNNNITTLRANTFFHLSACTFISLADNHISKILVGAFQGLVSVNEIWFGGNRLTKLETNVFKGLSSLEKLPLSNNGMNMTEDGAFNGLSNLKELYLYGNQFTSLRAHMFVGLHSLRKLVLTYNHISVIEVGVFLGTW